VTCSSSSSARRRPALGPLALTTNVTGIILLWPELAAKQIELMQEAFPDRNRLGVLWDTQSSDQFSAAEREAKARRLALRSLKLENPLCSLHTRVHRSHRRCCDHLSRMMPHSP
jgi:hypothetical protein